MIAVFDAEYHYNFWRPTTAIRNGDADGNDATERDAAWTPVIDTPMHPEYPTAHSIQACAVGAILQAEVGAAMGRRNWPACKPRWSHAPGERLLDVACDAALVGGPTALAWSRFCADARMRVRSRHVEAIAGWRQDRAYRIPGEFVVVAAAVHPGPSRRP